MMTLHLKINESAATITKNHCAGDGRALTKGRFVKFTSNGNIRSRKNVCCNKTNEKAPRESLKREKTENPLHKNGRTPTKKQKEDARIFRAPLFMSSGTCPYKIIRLPYGSNYLSVMVNQKS